MSVGVFCTAQYLHMGSVCGAASGRHRLLLFYRQGSGVGFMRFQLVGAVSDSWAAIAAVDHRHENSE